jgi:hypothetical protein
MVAITAKAEPAITKFAIQKMYQAFMGKRAILTRMPLAWSIISALGLHLTQACRAAPISKKLSFWRAAPALA